MPWTISGRTERMPPRNKRNRQPTINRLVRPQGGENKIEKM